MNQGILITVAFQAFFGSWVPSARPQPIPPLGRLVDSGGHLLHLNCTGEGSPVVVLESGAGDFSFVWALVQPRIAQFARVCSYDRAGYAWSEAGPQPRTMAQIAYELHTALANAREKGPYVLVGASLGGAMVRVFAANYPNDTAGMVLINATAGDGFIIVGGRPIRLRETSLKRKIPPVQAVFKPDPGASEPLVIRRTKSNTFVAVSPRSKLPPELQRIWLIARKQPKYSAAASSEFEFLPEEMDLLFAAAGANPHPLGSKPLVVLASDVAYDRAQGGMSAADLESDRKRLQAKLAALSTKGRLMIVKDCGTEIHLEQPEAVVSAIRDVAGMAKSAPKINDATTELKTARR